MRKLITSLIVVFFSQMASASVANGLPSFGEAILKEQFPEYQESQTNVERGLRHYRVQLENFREEVLEGFNRAVIDFRSKLVESDEQLELDRNKGRITTEQYVERHEYIKSEMCIRDSFKDCYLPAISAGKVGKFALFTLTDKAEQDDNCASIYHKSLLYLVSNAFEETCRIPMIHPDGEPILGMEKFIKQDTTIMEIIKEKKADWVRSPNIDAVGSSNASKSTHHGDFDDDEATVKATLARILDKSSAIAEISFQSSEMSRRGIRRNIDGS